MSDRFRGYPLEQYGPEVQDAINRIIQLTIATPESDGLLSAEDKAELDALGEIKLLYDTTAHWDAATGFIPAEGQLVVYSDHYTIVRDGHTLYVPGFKVGTGNGYIQDLVFVGDKTVQDLAQHIADGTVHVTASERLLWNSKLNIDDSAEVVNETLILNRN